MRYAETVVTRLLRSAKSLFVPARRNSWGGWRQRRLPIFEAKEKRLQRCRFYNSFN